MRWAATAVGVVGTFASLPTAASAPDVAADIVMLAVDGSSPSAATILVDGADVWVPADAMCARRLCRDGGRVHEHVRYVSLAQLAPGVTYVYDRDTGEVTVTSAPAERTLTVIDLSVSAPVGIEHVGTTSLFLNYALHGESADAGSPIAAGRASGFAEAGLSIGGALLYSAVSAPTPGTVVRGLSNASYDVGESMLRVVVGDDLASSGVLGSGGVIGGIHLRRDFAIDPYFVARPTLTHSGVVATPSTVEVYRGGQLVRRETVAAGPFKVDDVVGATGSDAQIVVRDSFGSARATVTTLVSPPLGLLRPGLSAFDYSLGLMREDLATDSFGYRRASAIAVHRRGITSWLTVGARGEATLDVQNGGVMATAQTGRVVLEASAALAHGGAGMAPAGSLSVSWQHHALGLTSLVRAVGRDYATLDLDAAMDRTLFGGEMSASWSMTSNATLLATGAFEHRRDEGDRVRAGLGYNMRVFGEVSLIMSAATAYADETGSSVEGLATVLTILGSRTSASVRAGYEGGRAVGGATLAQANPREGGIGYQVDAGYAGAPQLTTRITALTSRGRIEATAAWNAAGYRGAVDVAGGIVAIGGRIVATRPVQGGFALVRAKGAASSRVFLENQEVGTLDEHGDLVLPELQANYANRIRLDARDLPFDISITELERLVAPPRRGGAIVTFVGGTGVVVRGRVVVDRDGKELDASYGDIVLGHPPLRGPLGHGGVFELEPVPPGAHTGIVELDGRRCALAFVVPAGQREVDVGVVHCTEAPR